MGVHDAASHPARKFCERANLKLRGRREQAALVCEEAAARTKRARAAEGAFGAARDAKTAKPTPRWTTRRAPLPRAPTR